MRGTLNRERGEEKIIDGTPEIPANTIRNNQEKRWHVYFGKRGSREKADNSWHSVRGQVKQVKSQWYLGPRTQDVIVNNG